MTAKENTRRADEFADQQHDGHVQEPPPATGGT